MGTIFGSMAGQVSGYPADWAQKTPEQKREWRLNNFLNPKNLTFVSEKAKNNYKLRAQRLVDVYNVKEPDRVPVNLPVGNLPYTLYGINLRTAMYDYRQAIQACKKFNEQYSEELEYYASPFVTPGRVLELLDYRLYSWPGHRLRENVGSVQFMESEYMKAEEYDDLITDPSDFWLRIYLPRVFGALAPLQMLRPATDMVEIVNLVQFMPFANPQMQAMLQKLIEVGKEYEAMMKIMAEAGPSGPAH